MREAEEALAAIGTGNVDAIVVSGKHGTQVYSLSGAETVYRLIVESMQEAALTATPDGRILFCNSQLGVLLGLSPGSLLGRKLTELVPEDDHSALASILSTAQSRPVKGRIRLFGRTRAVPFYVSAGLIPGLEAPSICLVASDLSELMASDLELHRSNDELQRKTAQLRRLAAQLSQAEHRERNRLASVLHDGLQQLLVGAQMQMSRVIADDRDGHSPGNRRVAELIDQSIEMARSLALEISPPIRAGAGMLTVLTWLARSMQKHSLKVKVTSKGVVPPAGDEMTLFLFLAVQELLLNTVKHAGVRTADIWLGEVGDHLEIRVSDQGLGFDPDVVDRTLGMRGFGLFSIRERLSLLGGQLTINSRPGAGTMVKLEVPLSRVGGGEHPTGRSRKPARQSPQAPPRNRNRPGGSAQRQRQNTDGRSGRVRVMIVEDDGVVALQIRQMLVGLGYDVPLVARSGEEAVNKTPAAKPDLILMDIQLKGGISGIEAARRIAVLSDVPIVYVTAFSDPETLEQAKVTEPYGYLVKPFDERSLHATIQTSLFRHWKLRATGESAGRRAREE